LNGISDAFSLDITSSSLISKSCCALTSKAPRYGPPVVIGEESLMSQKAHGTSEVPVQKDLRWNCGADLADRICNFNRHYAENAGYWERSTTFLKEEEEQQQPIPSDQLRAISM